MTLEQFKTEMKKLSESLNSANTYQTVLKLKKEIAELIKQFNTIAKAPIEESERNSLLAIQKEMSILKKTYEDKIKSLKSNNADQSQSKSRATEDSDSTTSMINNPLDPTGKSKIRFRFGTIGTPEEVAKKAFGRESNFIFSSDGSSDLYDRFLKAQAVEKKTTVLKI